MWPLTLLRPSPFRSNTTLRRGATSQSKVMTLSPADEKCDHSSARTPALTGHLFIVQVSCRYNALPFLWTWCGAAVDWTLRFALTQNGQAAWREQVGMYM